MPSLVRRRRRRRLSRAATLVLVGAVALILVVLLVVGGIVKSSSASTAYWRNVDRSFASLARVPIAQSDRAASQLADLPRSFAAESRVTLEAQLDTLVQAGNQAWQEAETCTTPPPAGGAGTDLVAALHDRALALSDLRTTLDRLLGMEPLQVEGAAASGTTASAPAALSPAAAVAGLQRVAALLSSSVHEYSAARRALRRAPGRVILPAPTWKRAGSAWAPAHAASLVATLEGATSLAPVRLVGLSADDVALTPPPIPPATASGASGSEVPPTRSLVVTVLAVNKGNEPERGITVLATASSATGTAARRSRRVSLAAGGTEAVDLELAVAPGRTYTITLDVTPPLPNTSGTPGLTSTDTFTVAVAPGTA